MCFFYIYLSRISLLLELNFRIMVLHEECRDTGILLFRLEPWGGGELHKINANYLLYNIVFFFKQGIKGNPLIKSSDHEITRVSHTTLRYWRTRAHCFLLFIVYFFSRRGHFGGDASLESSIRNI